MKTLPDKSIQLVVGEILPPVLQGKYEPVPGEPLRYRLVFPLCVYHCQSIKVLPCGRKVVDEYCDLKQVFVSPSICQTCKERSCPSVSNLTSH